MKTVCPHCNQEYDVDDNFLQQEVTCTSCNQNFTVNKAKFCADCGTVNPAQAFKCRQCGKDFQLPAEGNFAGRSLLHESAGNDYEPITMFTPLRKYAVFHGRASRKEFWLWMLFNAICHILLLIITALTAGGAAFFQWIFILVFLVPTLAVAIRRLHDIGLSGWWTLINFVPILGGLALLGLAINDSEPGENCYGDNPKGIAERNESYKVSLLWPLIATAIGIIFFVGIPVAMLPALNSARERASIITCGTHLKQIGFALNTYSADYAPYFPVAGTKQTFATLIKESCLTEEDIVCPSSEKGYIYLGAGITTENVKDDLPIVMDFPDNHKKYINILYAGGYPQTHTLSRTMTRCTDVLSELFPNLKESEAGRIIWENAQKIDDGTSEITPKEPDVMTTPTAESKNSAAPEEVSASNPGFKDKKKEASQRGSSYVDKKDAVKDLRRLWENRNNYKLSKDSSLQERQKNVEQFFMEYNPPAQYLGLKTYSSDSIEHFAVEAGHAELDGFRIALKYGIFDEMGKSLPELAVKRFRLKTPFHVSCSTGDIAHIELNTRKRVVLEGMSFMLPDNAVVYPKLFKPPFTLMLSVKPYQNNARILLCGGELIFNWEGDRNYFRSHFYTLGIEHHVKQGGFLGQGKWSNITVNVLPNSMRIIVNGRIVTTINGDFSSTKSYVGLYSCLQGSMDVNKFEISYSEQ